MIMSQDIILQILLGNVTVAFIPVRKDSKSDKILRCGEQPLTTGKGPTTYAILDVIKNQRKYITDIADDELHRGGFVNKEAFILWWISNNHQITDEINLVFFELLSIRKKGKNLIRDNNMRVPNRLTQKVDMTIANEELVNRLKE
jgi:hypothetical protein